MSICKSSGSDDPEVKMAFLFTLKKFFESRQSETETKSFSKTSMIKAFNQGRASDTSAADADLWPATKQKFVI